MIRFCCLVAALPLLVLRPGALRAADAAHPTVVELFQSQGCSSCPPANAAVMALTQGRPDLLMLSWQVTYWDGLGWKDSFGDPAFTARQRDYAAAWGRDNVFTPEVVVNGRADLVGSDGRSWPRWWRGRTEAMAGRRSICRPGR